MKIPNRKLNTKSIKILMIQKDITTEKLMIHFDVTRDSINKAINGERPNFHFRILDYLRAK